MMIVYDIGIKGHLFLLVEIDLQKNLSESKRRQNFFYLFLIYMEREKTQEFPLEMLIKDVVILKRREKTSRGGKDFLHKKPVASLVSDKKSVCICCMRRN